MQTDHAPIARRAFELALLTDPPRQPAEALRFVTLLLSLLPPEEGAGYIGKGGDNIAPLPNGVMVSVSRVCYPDGQIYKVMSDAPNGNPQWVDNGLLPSDQRYIPYPGSYMPHPTPVPDVNAPVGERLLHLENDGAKTDLHLDLLDAQVRDLGNLHLEVDKQIGSINRHEAMLDAQVAGLNTKLDATIAAMQEALKNQPKLPKWWPF